MKWADDSTAGRPSAATRVNNGKPSWTNDAATAPGRPAPAPGAAPPSPSLTGSWPPILHHRHALPQVAVAALFNVRPETINRRVRDTRYLLEQAGHTIQPSAQPLATLDDLYDLDDLARTEDITVPTRTTTAS